MPDFIPKGKKEKRRELLKLCDSLSLVMKETLALGSGWGPTDWLPASAHFVFSRRGMVPGLVLFAAGI